MLGLQSFNATLKNERVHRIVYPTKDKAINDIASWIELRYEPYSSSLSPGMPHPERARKRVPGPEEGSLKHKQAPSEKHPAVQCAGRFVGAGGVFVLLGQWLRLLFELVLR